MQYTIKHATPTGKTDPTYGNEYLVRFNEDERTVRMSRRFVPQPGTPMAGEIIENRYGSYFKKSAEPVKNEKQDRPQVQDKSYAMFVSYAKDLMIQYLNFVDWDFSKIDEDGLSKVLDLVGKASRALRDSETTPIPKKQELFDPFTSTEEDI